MLECLSVVRRYILSSSFHGFRYLVEEERHWSERIFWLICCITSWIASGFLMQSTLKDYQNNAISFGVDTSYLHWNTDFPVVAVCEADNDKRISEVADDVFGKRHSYDVETIMREYVFFDGSYHHILENCGFNTFSTDVNLDCFKKNYIDFSKKIRSSCKEIFKSCRWNKKRFNCCKYFLEVETELGVCYAINSIQTRRESFQNLEMVSNLKTGVGTLYLELFGVLKIYTLGKEEVPSLSMQANSLLINSGFKYHRLLKVKYIENDNEVKDTSIHQRKCLFSSDLQLDAYRHYSYSACDVQCRQKAQLKVCNCNHHLMPEASPNLYCNLTGLFCLSKHNIIFNKSFSCDCLPSCTEIELTILRDRHVGISEDYAIVEISLHRLPTEKFKRNVVRGKLDLVVSLGGAAALFLGASLLSIVEILHYFVIHSLNNLVLKRIEQRQQRVGH